MNDNSNLIKVYTGTEVAVISLKNRLEEIGITGLMKNIFQSGVSAGFSGGTPSSIDFYIQESDVKKAEVIIAEFIKEN